MRLFKNTAYFLTLISSTIYDVRIFSLMLMIIIFAFANFFYVLNDNVKGEEFYYVGTFVGNKAVDALISTYLAGLGEFDFDGYKSGPNVYVAWTFFLMGTFLVLVVFMNMLIAIMGDTFANVQEIQDQACLREQCALIGDFLYLLDMQQLFKGKKYIILLTPVEAVEEEVADLSSEF